MLSQLSRVGMFIAISGAAIFGSGFAQATTVPYPYIDVVENPGDTGAVASGLTPELVFGGTAVGVITGPGTIDYFPVPAAFSLSASYSAALTSADGQPNTYDYTNGLITVGTTADPLLTATFSDMRLQSASIGSGPATIDYVINSSSLVYTGGSIAGSLGSGEMTGSFTVGTSIANGNGYADLSKDFTGSNLTDKIGPVVPLPATLPLLVSGLGLLLVAGLRRHRPGRQTPYICACALPSLVLSKL
jgi:hypothetical protein